MNFQNPILVKELRQLVRGKTFFAIFFGALAVQLFVAGYVLRTQGEHVHIRYDGYDLFFELFYVLAFAIGILVPAHFMVKLKRELWGADRDLMFVTALTPAQIVAGKLLSALAVAAMIASAFLPAIMLTVLLGGIGALEICRALAILFLLLALMYPAGILVAAMDVGANWLKWIFMLGFIASLTPIYVFAVICLAYVDFDPATLCGFLVLWLCLFAALCVSAVAALAPATTNRMKTPRIVYTALFVIMMLGEYATLSTTENATFVIILFILLALVHVSCERLFVSRRTLTHLPETLARRLLAFPFSSGFASGFCWCALNIFLVAALNVILGQDIRHPNAQEEDAILVTAFSLATLALIFGALRTLSPEKRPNANPGNETAFVLTATLVTFLVFFFVSMIGTGTLWNDIKTHLTDENTATSALTYIATIALVLSPHIVTAFLRFQRPEDA